MGKLLRFSKFEDDATIKEYVEYKIASLEKIVFTFGFFAGTIFAVALIGIGKLYFGG